MGVGTIYGIPITEDIRVQIPADIAAAWKKFHNWWEENHNGYQIHHKQDIPQEVWDAMLKVLPTPIPGYEGSTLADSCYWILVLTHVDNPPQDF